VQGGECKAALHPAAARFATYDDVKRRRDPRALICPGFYWGTTSIALTVA